MFEFMHNVVTIFWFAAIVIIMVLGAILIGIEIYDRLTGADVKRQAQLDRLRQLDDEEDGMYPR